MTYKSTSMLFYNRRETVKVVVSKEGDGGFALVDVDTIWRNLATDQLIHRKGRLCKIYTRVKGDWLFHFQTGLLDYRTRDT